MAEKVADTSDNADSVGGELNKETNHRVRLCEPCFEEGAEVPAAKFCVECEDYLCETCVQHHRKVKMSKTHELIDSCDTVQSSKKREGKDIFICSIHQGEITLYCNKHDKLCCSKCVSGVHMVCGDSICKVEDVAEKEEEKQELKTVVEKIITITVGARENKQRATASIETGTEHFEKEVEEVRKTVNEEIARIKTIELACDSVLREVEKWNNLVEDGKQTKAYGKLFIVTKMASQQLEILAETLQVLVENNKWKFNSLSLRSLPGTPDKRRVPILLKKLPLTGDAKVRDICPIGHKIAVADGRWLRIILINIDNTYSRYEHTEIKLHTAPWEIAVNSFGQMYVSLQMQSKIMKYLYPLSDHKNCIEISTGANRSCIQCHRDVLKIQGLCPFFLQEMDASENKKAIHKEDAWSECSTEDIHSTIDEKTGSMFLIGRNMNVLRRVTNNGDVKSISLSKPIANPGGIVLDSNGTFLVSSESDKSIKRLDMDGVLEDFITGLEFEPHGLGLDIQRRLLYVGGINCQSIHVYSI